MLFALSTAYIEHQEYFDKKAEDWGPADTLDPKIPTYLEVLHDSPSFYCVPYDTGTCYRYYYWSAGIDWDQMYSSGYGEVNVAVGMPHKDQISIKVSGGLGLKQDYGDDPQWSTYRKFETYRHAEIREKYDPEISVPGWYTGYLFSRRNLLVRLDMATIPHDWGRYFTPAKFDTSLTINEKVLCLDGMIFAPKQELDDSSWNYSVEDSMSPEHESVKMVSLNRDVDVYGYVYQFRLSCSFYDYYSPYYEW
jgi:hypothetical protein